MTESKDFDHPNDFVTENSSLLSVPLSNDSKDTSQASVTTSGTSQFLWEEMDRPWPSTFERSITLLACPIVKPQQVDLFIKSPKPGSTPHALARRRNLDRGFYTPETGPIQFSYLRTETTEEDDDDDDDNKSGGSFRMGIARNQSLNVNKSMEYWKSNAASNIEQVQKFQQEKAAKAQEYRKKLLSKSTNDNLSGASKSHKSDSHGGTGIMPETTFFQCIFNLANILMGMGLLGLPYAFGEAGWLGGGLCLMLFGAIAWRTSILIGRELNGDPRPSSYFVDSPFKSPLPPGSDPRARMYPPITSFPCIARAAFGQTGCAILSILLYFELFSCVCIFLVSIGDHLQELFPTFSASTHVAIAMIMSLIPTVLLRTPSLLSYFSMIGTFATIVVVLSVIASALVEGDISESNAAKVGLEGTQEHHPEFRPKGLILALGIVSYCFSGHAIVPSIYSSMRKPQEFEDMATFTFTVVMAACLAVGFSGYYMFGTTVQDQVTLSLKQSSKAMGVMNALTFLMVLTAFSKITLTMFPLAIGMEEIIAPFLTSEHMVLVCSIVIKVVLTVLAGIVAIFCPSFSFLCALTGMICTMSVSVVFPAAAHYVMFHRKLSFWEKLSDILIATAGCIMAIVGTIMTIKHGS